MPAVGAQARPLAVIAGNRAGCRPVFKRQFQGDIGGAAKREPVGDLLAVLEFREAGAARPRGGRCRLSAHDEFRAGCRQGNGGQIVLVLLAVRHRGHDGLRGELQLSGTHPLIQRGHVALVRLPGHHELQIGVAGDVHGIEGVDRGLAGKEGVHIEVRGDQAADDGIIGEDVIDV